MSGLEDLAPLPPAPMSFSAPSSGSSLMDRINAGDASAIGQTVAALVIVLLLWYYLRTEVTLVTRKDCGYCQAFMPVFLAVRDRTHLSVRYRVLDTAVNPAEVARLGVTSVPTVIKRRWPWADDERLPDNSRDFASFHAWVRNVPLLLMPDNVYVDGGAIGQYGHVDHEAVAAAAAANGVSHEAAAAIAAAPTPAAAAAAGAAAGVPAATAASVQASANAAKAAPAGQKAAAAQAAKL